MKISLLFVEKDPTEGGDLLDFNHLLFLPLRGVFLVLRIEPLHEISNNFVCETSKGSDQTAHMRSLICAV